MTYGGARYEKNATILSVEQSPPVWQKIFLG